MYNTLPQGGTGGTGSKRRITDVNTDHGYDTSDPFVDDSEAVSFFNIFTCYNIFNDHYNLLINRRLPHVTVHDINQLTHFVTPL